MGETDLQYVVTEIAGRPGRARLFYSKVLCSYVRFGNLARACGVQAVVLERHYEAYGAQREAYRSLICESFVVIAWILAILLAVGFTYFGGIKLISSPGMVQEFAQIGAGQWLRYVTGLLEVSGAIGVLIPRVRFWAGLQIAAVMAGATFTNIAILRVRGLAGLTAILMTLALTLAWLRRHESDGAEKAAHA